MSLHLFQPADPETTAEFMRSVQIREPSIGKQIAETAGKVARALGATVGTVAGAPVAAAEAVAYAGANVLALPSIGLNIVGSALNRTRTRVYRTLAG
jgi:hypothetical protein